MLQDYNYVNGNIYHHLPLAGQNSQVTHALALVYEKMIGRYHSCVDQFPVGGEGGGLFNPGLCGCIGEYSVEDGLRDFFKNLLGMDDVHSLPINILNETLNFLEEEGWSEYAVETVNFLIDLLQNGIIEFEDLIFLFEEGLIDEDDQVVIKKENYANMTPAQRGQHVYKWIRYIRKLEKCGLAPCCKSYEINGDFFYNVDNSTKVWPTTVKMANNQAADIKIEWTSIWAPSSFRIKDMVGPYGTLEPDVFKLVYPKLGSVDPQFGIITIYISSADLDEVAADLDLPCN